MFFWIVLLCWSGVRSWVLDSINQNNKYVKKYCQSGEHCPEGTHVMCMYYANGSMGELCSRDSTVVEVTEEIQEVLLDMVNHFRAKIASGNETGKDGQPLPKAFGMERLKWDKTLADFAQVWANQCTIRFDLCRASDKFADPGQMVSMVRFTYPDWNTVANRSGNKSLPLAEKDMFNIRHTINTVMSISYHQKRFVTKEILENYPDLPKMNLAGVRVYLTMIYKGATHMGCGMSAYVDYHLRSTTQSSTVIFNTIELVCNFSGQPKRGTKVIDTVPEEGASVNCGCPPDTKEDEDCLCIREDPREPEEQETKNCSADDPGCKPSVVVLPIIAVEDAPPEMLYHPPNTDETRRVSNKRDMERTNVYQSPAYRLADIGRDSEILIPNNLKLPPQTMSELSRRFGNSETRHISDVRNRYFDKQFLVPGQKYRYRDGGSPVRHTPLNKMHPPLHRDSSIFTRASKFELPSQIKHIDHHYPIKNWTRQIKKDVSPRKNFSTLQDIAIAYLNRRYTKMPLTTTFTPKFGIHGFNTTLSKRNFEIKNANDESDNKLLTLLDNLEEKVKHIKIKSNVKKIVDARIRKIYNDFVGDGNQLLKTKNTKTEEEFMKKLEEKYINDDKILSDYAEVYVPELDSTLLQRRHQNSIHRYDYPAYDRYKNKYDILDSDDRDVYGNLEKGDFKNDNKRTSGHKYFDKVKINLNDDDLLRAAKRKYYQKKIENIERKLNSIRGHRRRSELKNSGPHFRPVVNPSLESRPSNHVDPFYVPERAKFLHGF